MALQSKFVASNIKRSGLTHFLAIPLVTPTSRLQILDSFKCLRNDLKAVGVPIDAIRSPGLLHLSLDILLRLDTPESMAKATEILEKLSIKEILPTNYGTSTSDKLFRHSSMALPRSGDDTNNSMAPPSVSISGLSCRPGTEAEAIFLNTRSYDATHRVRNLRLRLAHAYHAAGLSPKTCPRDLQTQAATGEILDSCDALVGLVKIYTRSKIAPSKRIPGKMIKVTPPPFDARGLLERYKDHVWMENVLLDRVSICKLGIHKADAGELLEVFSVPLS